jgi:hypothetical protein
MPAEPGSFRRPLLRLLAAAEIGLAVALALDFVVSVEWTTAGCTSTDADAAAYGFPLPYTRWCGYTSLRYTVLPQILALDLLLVAAPFAALAALLRRRALIAAAVVATLGISLRTALYVAGLALGFYEPALGFFTPLTEFRPVGPSFGPLDSNGCTPSPFWFP